jgi:metacaspase-1
MKRATCIGINDYPGADNDLAGCVRDCERMADLLDRHRFKVEPLINEQASRAIWLETLDKLCTDAKSESDVVWLTVSSHGSYLPDDNGDEPDGRDECYVPHDFQTAGLIRDDDIARIVAKARGMVVLFSDSCHSGTVARAMRNLDAGPVRHKAKFLSPIHAGIYAAEPLRRVQHLPRQRPRYLQSHVVSLSGCRDHEFSYDAEFDGQPDGAFTHYALRAFDAHATMPHYTFNRWYYDIRKFLPDQRYPQTPQIHGPMALRDRNVF